MIMLLTHPNRGGVLTTTVLVLLVVAVVNTATANAGVGNVRQYNKQKYYPGGSVRGARRATNGRNLMKSEKSESVSESKSEKSSKSVKSATNNRNRNLKSDKSIKSNKSSKVQNNDPDEDPAVRGIFQSAAGPVAAGYNDQSVAVQAQAQAASKKGAPPPPSAGYNDNSMAATTAAAAAAAVAPRQPEAQVVAVSPETIVDASALIVGREGRNANTNGNATTTADDELSADDFEDENNATAIISDTNFTQEEEDDADELDFEDDDVPIDDNNATTPTTISNITTPVFVRTPISNELNPAAVGAADGGGNGTNDASCSAAPICNRNGLTGDCCPTSEGVSLACCARNFGSLPEPAPAAAVEGED
mmetsp:Transcript_3587/g.3980  ORF Transcript_3587/g.3980 Transcript_3587/m.3980 type:complete len:363 (-) Transcript_3587:383-1471(-)